MKRNLALTVALLAVIATLGLLKVSGTVDAQQGVADKAVLDVILDRGDGYPGAGSAIPTSFPFVIHHGEPQTMISVTSLDALLLAQPPEPLANSLVAFYADIPQGCYGRWWDPAHAFPSDVYSVQGQPTAEPYSPQQLGSEVPYPPIKVPGDQDASPPSIGLGLPVPGQTFEADLHFQTGAYGIVEFPGMPPIPLTRFFDFHCDTDGRYVFWFCNKIEPMPPYTDPNFPPGPWPGNNVNCRGLDVLVQNEIGGMAEAPSIETTASSDGGSSASTFAMVGGAAGLLVLLASGGWYARRRLRAG